MKEKEEIVYEIMGNTCLKQVYFVDNTDIDTIEFVKLLLEYSTDILDSDVEKAILMRSTDNIIADILNMNFKNPSSWFVSFKNNGVSYEVVDIPSLRLMEKYFNGVKERVEKRSTSNLEKVLLTYDIVKLMDYSDNEELDSIPIIIKNKTANSKGFNLMFSTLLSRVGIKSYVGDMITDGESSYITLASVEDEKYGISGMYLFDPASDSLPSKKYKDTGIRRLNYNFFGLVIENLNYIKTGDELSGILSVLSIQNSKFRHQRTELLSKRDNGISRRSIVESLGEDMDTIYDKCSNITPIDIGIILEVIANVCYANDFTENKDLDIMKLIKDNYEAREKELFRERLILEEQIDV